MAGVCGRLGRGHPAPGTGMAGGRPTGEAWLWLLLLGPVFLLVYVGCNQYAAGLPPAAVHHIAFAWERRIPFLAWTIVPYQSIYLLYVTSPFLCRTRVELRTYVWRFLAAVVASAVVFLSYPMGFGTPRPAPAGFFGPLYALQYALDQPFNQMPSLHVALLVVLNLSLRHALNQPARVGLGLWSALVAVATLTTWQHHVVDLLAGGLLGIALCVLVRPPCAPA